jgi:hypothetical protein
MERMVHMPPKQHKDMKLGKSKVKVSHKASPPRKLARMELDGVRIWQVVRRFIVAPYSQTAARAILTSLSPTSHSRRVSGYAQLGDEGEKPSLAEK